MSVPELPQALRGWIYRIATIAAPFILYYGLASDDEVALWIGGITSLLGFGLASVNTPVKAQPPEA